jgi:hypothetical protein
MLRQFGKGFVHHAGAKQRRLTMVFAKEGSVSQAEPTSF